MKVAQVGFAIRKKTFLGKYVTWRNENCEHVRRAVLARLI
jgi:hypothetical protein